MKCKNCGANIPIKENATEGKCIFCGNTQKVQTAEEEKLDALICAKKKTLDECNKKLNGKIDEQALIKKTLKLAISVIVVFIIFLLSWHFGAERSFKRNQVILIFVSVLVIPGFIVGYLGGAVLSFYLAKQTSRSSHAAIVLAICTFNVYGVCIAIHYIAHSNYIRVKKEISGLTKIRDDVQNEYDTLKSTLKDLELSQKI